MKLFTPNFTLLLLGQISSLLGNYTLRFAVSMYVLDLTGSAGVYSLIMTLSMLPTIVLSPLGGVLADRADRRKIMVARTRSRARWCCWGRCGCRWAER